MGKNEINELSGQTQEVRKRITKYTEEKVKISISKNKKQKLMS